MSHETKKEKTLVQVNQALLDANGDFPLAAAALGLTEKGLEERVDGSEALRARWREKSPTIPPSSSLISRPEDLAIAEAVQREEKKLAAGLESLGLSTRGKSLALACQTFQRDHFSKIIQITGGGITKAFLDALEEVELINQRLANLDVKEEQVIAYESLLREDRRGLLDFIYKAAAKADASVMIQAKIQKMFGDDGKPALSSKPGFAALKKVTP